MPGVVHPWFSTYFLVPKPTPGTFRGILDMRGVNEHVVSRSFKMDTLRTVNEILRPGDYMTSIDISSAYPHVPVARRFRNLMCMRTSQELDLTVPTITDPDFTRDNVQTTGFSKFQSEDFLATSGGTTASVNSVSTPTSNSEFSDLPRD